jgi:very-short-patch-repair endonuclease
MTCHICAEQAGPNRRMLRVARDLRNNPTIAERLLWSRLRRRQLAGFKFRRQHSVGVYISDFACVEALVIVAFANGGCSRNYL